MQAIAAEFGLSETAFTLPPTTSRATYRLRIFTPRRELPFAGHPSIGAAWALAFAGHDPPGDVVQECGSGAAAGARRPARGRVVGGEPEVGPDLDGAALAATVGLTADDLDAALPAGIAAAGVPFAFLPVRPDAVARAVPDAAAVAAATAEQTGLAVVAVDVARHGDLRMFGPRWGCSRTRRRARRRSRWASTSPRAGAAGGPVGAVDRAGGRDGAAVDAGGARGVAGGAAVEVAVRGEARMVAKGGTAGAADA